MKKLVIFDMDGVLVKKGNNALHLNRQLFAVNKVFGVKIRSIMFPATGMTDTAIILELARRVGISKTNVRKHIKKLYEAEIRYFKQIIGECNYTSHKGVKSLLRRLKKDGYILCLATGNLEPVARLKLREIGITEFFNFGGFGTFSEKAEVIKEAIRQAEKRYGKFKKSDIFYLGDSPFDIEGGRKAGVNMIAVATGGYPIKVLSKNKPDYLLKDLTDTRKVIAIINH